MTHARPTGHPGYSETLPRTPESVAVARRLVTTAVATWRMGGLADDAAVLVSELVTNAVQHARSRAIRVTVTRPEPGYVRIAVVDKSKAAPVRCEADEDDERGRGLALVEVLAESWGTDALPWGKRVWAECALKTTDCIPGGAGKDSEEILGLSDLPGPER